MIRRGGERSGRRRVRYGNLGREWGGDGTRDVSWEGGHEGKERRRGGMIGLLV